MSTCIETSGAAGAIWLPPPRTTCDPHAGSGGIGGARSDHGDGSLSLGQPCGMPDAISCNADEFCKRDWDKECGANGGSGVCTSKPNPFECKLDAANVCGCDGKTYGAECLADSAGVSVRYDGQCGREEYCASVGGRVVEGADAVCKPNDDTLWLGTKAKCCVPSPTDGKSCKDHAACGPKEYCSHANGQGCGEHTADATGKCDPKPEACTKLYDPVCGCDVVSYDNSCEAARQGVSLLHAGSCTAKDCESIGGRVASGKGSAAMCSAVEVEHTYVVSDDAGKATITSLCCIKQSG